MNKKLVFFRYFIILLFISSSFYSIGQSNKSEKLDRQSEIDKINIKYDKKIQYLLSLDDDWYIGGFDDFTINSVLRNTFVSVICIKKNTTSATKEFESIVESSTDYVNKNNLGKKILEQAKEETKNIESEEFKPTLSESTIFMIAIIIRVGFKALKDKINADAATWVHENLNKDTGIYSTYYDRETRDQMDRDTYDASKSSSGRSGHSTIDHSTDESRDRTRRIGFTKDLNLQSQLNFELEQAMALPDEWFYIEKAALNKKSVFYNPPAISTLPKQITIPSTYSTDALFKIIFEIWVKKEAAKYRDLQIIKTEQERAKALQKLKP